MAEFSASGTVITFRGFPAARKQGRDEEDTRRKKAAKLAAQEERRLPSLTAGEALTVEHVEADGHETSPPPRFTRGDAGEGVGAEEDRSSVDL